MRVNAAEQVFRRTDGGCSSLIWLDHPTRPVILMLHDHELWRGWPDLWQVQPVEPITVPEGYIDTERGFGYLVRQAGLIARIGHAVRREQPYQAEVEELGSGWQLTDSYGRVLELEVNPCHWWVKDIPAQ